LETNLADSIHVVRTMVGRPTAKLDAPLEISASTKPDALAEIFGYGFGRLLVAATWHLNTSPILSTSAVGIFVLIALHYSGAKLVFRSLMET
jgi:hypothetical protein